MDPYIKDKSMLNCELNSDQKTSYVLNGSISVCPQTDVAKLRPIIIRKPKKPFFTKFHTGGVSPRFVKKFQC